KDGAKLVNAVSNSTVPKFTVITGNSYGAGNYAMCGKAYDPRLIVAWPSAKIAVMGGAQAANTILQMQVGTLEAKGAETMNPEEKAKILKDIKDHYDKTTTPYYAAARLWVDAVIDPLETRKWISIGIEAANNAPVEKFNVGVMQT
ncbi:MAG: acyl-CoA carboxylase subunit beta, partial [Chitinophagales bacterium]|nr:acyl-CoA carboxylase subunit beta [Chitinophagales bacterium]